MSTLLRGQCRPRPPPWKRKIVPTSQSQIVPVRTSMRAAGARSLVHTCKQPFRHVDHAHFIRQTVRRHMTLSMDALLHAMNKATGIPSARHTTLPPTPAEGSPSVEYQRRDNYGIGHCRRALGAKPPYLLPLPASAFLLLILHGCIAVGCGCASSAPQD